MQNSVHSLFELLVLSLANAALMALGLIEDLETNATKIVLDDAKHNIEVIEMLKEKSKGNLTNSEVELLDSVLYDLQLKFVEVKKNLC